jgi:hypothetical protein
MRIVISDLYSVTMDYDAQTGKPCNVQVHGFIVDDEIEIKYEGDAFQWWAINLKRGQSVIQILTNQAMRNKVSDDDDDPDIMWLPVVNVFDLECFEQSQAPIDIVYSTGNEEDGYELQEEVVHDFVSAHFVD